MDKNSFYKIKNSNKIIIDKNNIKDCLKYLSLCLNNIVGIKSYFRVSNNNVPLLVIEHDKTRYSIAYFLKYKNFKIFYDYCNFDVKQKSLIIESGKDVYRFFKEL